MLLNLQFLCEKVKPDLQLLEVMEHQSPDEQKKFKEFKQRVQHAVLKEKLRETGDDTEESEVDDFIDPVLRTRAPAENITPPYLRKFLPGGGKLPGVYICEQPTLIKGTRVFIKNK